MSQIRQRRTPSRLLVQARAERLPFGDDVFDCALAVLTIHRWSSVGEGLRELRRVASGLSDGTWQREHAALMERDAMDVGYRLVIADRSSQ